MTVQEIMEQIKNIKGNYVNGNITGDDMVELMEDLIHDVEGNDGMDWVSDEYETYEEPDFTKLEIL